MHNPEDITIFLTPIDAELFLKFQKYHALFELMVTRGVFDQKNANIMLNFDMNGFLASIERHDILFSRRSELSTD